jgi:hypothetical protein
MSLSYLLKPIQDRYLPTLIKARTGLFLALILAFFAIAFVILSHTSLKDQMKRMEERNRVLVYDQVGRPLGLADLT